MRYFLSEYEAHITDKTCPASVCSDLFEFQISAERCNGCGLCVEVCREEAIQGKRKEPYRLDASKCIKCRSCLKVCARRAIIGVPIANRLVLSEVA